MSDIFRAILDYLVANSELARSLEQPVSLEEMLAHQTDKEQCIRLLTVLPEFAKDKFKLSNCLLDNVVPYDSLIGLSTEDLAQLGELCNYLMLPSDICKKISKVIENGIDIEKYNFDVRNTAEWARIGDLRGLKWAYESSFTVRNLIFGASHWNKETCNVAAENGHLDCLRFAHEAGFPLSVRICEWAAGAGHLDCLQYAYKACGSDGPKYGTGICSYAAWKGHLDCLIWLHEAGCPWDALTTEHAADGGHFECLRYACNPPSGDRCPWYNNLCEVAAAGGSVDCLRYAREVLGCKFDTITCTNAGNLDCLKYLHKAGRPWNEKTCYEAAYNGRLDCLRYLHQHGCPWDEQAFIAANCNNNFDCLRYLCENDKVLGWYYMEIGEPPVSPVEN